MLRLRIYVDTSVIGGCFDEEFKEDSTRLFEEFVSGEKVEESVALANAYIKEGAVAEKSLSDARHIAIATVERVDTLVSWNFKHIVNIYRIHLLNSVNLKLGYPMLEIRSPKEVLYER